MNLRDFEYLSALARLQHFGKASEACHVSQPTLSMQIKKLEETVGVPLLERGKGMLRLTEAGQAVLERAKNILKEVKAIKDIGRQYQDPFMGEMTLGAFPTLAPFIFPRIVPHLNKMHPKQDLLLVEERTPELIKRLKSGALDMVLLAYPVEEPEFEGVEIWEESFLIALSKNNPLSQKKTINLSDLKSEKLLLLEESHCLSGQALEVCTWIQAEENDRFRATSLETLRQMVASNLGVTFVPEMAATVQLPSLAYRSLSDKRKPGRKIGLFWRKTSPFSFAYQEMAEEMRASLKC